MLPHILQMQLEQPEIGKDIIQEDISLGLNINLHRD